MESGGEWLKGVGWGREGHCGLITHAFQTERANPLCNTWQRTSAHYSPSPSSRTTYLPIPLAPPHCCPFTSVCRYATYCNNFPVAQQLLEGCRHNDQTANFVLFEQQCAQTKECAGLDLGSFLIKPVQRICKYVFH